MIDQRDEKVRVSEHFARELVRTDDYASKLVMHVPVAKLFKNSEEGLQYASCVSEYITRLQNSEPRNTDYMNIAVMFGRKELEDGTLGSLVVVNNVSKHDQDLRSVIDGLAIAVATYAHSPKKPVSGAQ